MSRFPPKCEFTPQEDALLIESVHTHGSSDWSLIASLLPGRNLRQCRERWNNYVNPALTHQEWTQSEDAFLLEKFNQLGPKWELIAAFFPGRGKNNIRNHYSTLQRKQARENSLLFVGPPQNPLVPIQEDVAELAAPQAPDVTSTDPLAFLDTIQGNSIFSQTEAQSGYFDDYFW
jgi:hypothetical protein